MYYSVCYTPGTTKVPLVEHVPQIIHVLIYTSLQMKNVEIKISKNHTVFPKIIQFKNKYVYSILLAYESILF